MIITKSTANYTIIDKLHRSLGTLANTTFSKGSPVVITCSSSPPANSLPSISYTGLRIAAPLAPFALAVYYNEEAKITKTGIDGSHIDCSITVALWTMVEIEAPLEIEVGGGIFRLWDGEVILPNRGKRNGQLLVFL
ncbi:hypothetical protein PanWU01x14_274270 [Parasponia andersonii]|uniref:Uncharacterized protein n=1 Tax=Parasponia andersonii TaxID=3476 RepID=A0A2P5B3N1_PARAD|nr:hypothetical protein PanWU01x14_274270 [Parasponia andersonii]